jgi:hypothetical protein
MDATRRQSLIERIRQLGLPSLDRPLPLVTLEEFFIGNDDYGSIGCNLTPMLGPKFFFEALKSIRDKPEVQEVLVEINEVVERDVTMWPFSDRVYVYTSATPDDIRKWTASLRPDNVQEGFAYGIPACAPKVQPGYRCYSVWWD